ncbi:MAG: transmembrane 220 family protein, partial [Chitinophagaceae bacterium]
MVVFNYIFSGVFILFALLQINDPDPYVWIPIYGVVALICFFNARKKYDR